MAAKRHKKRKKWKSCFAILLRPLRLFAAKRLAPSIKGRLEISIQNLLQTRAEAFQPEGLLQEAGEPLASEAIDGLLLIEAAHQ